MSYVREALAEGADEREQKAYEKGFQDAIDLLKANEYYGHYAQFMAKYLEKKLKEIRNGQ
jgi:hypothetical protein